MNDALATTITPQSSELDTCDDASTIHSHTTGWTNSSKESSNDWQKDLATITSADSNESDFSCISLSDDENDIAIAAIVPESSNITEEETMTTESNTNHVAPLIDGLENLFDRDPWPHHFDAHTDLDSFSDFGMSLEEFEFDTDLLIESNTIENVCSEHLDDSSELMAEFAREIISENSID